MQRSRRHRILCVAPSSHNLDELCSTLRSRYEVMVSSAADRAVALCASNAVATVVLASEFVTASGWTLAQALKSVRPEIPVILLAKNHDEVQIPHVLDAVHTTPAGVLHELKHRLDGKPKDGKHGDGALRDGGPPIGARELP
jgi:DNA-binding NtrC family response regulator